MDSNGQIVKQFWEAFDTSDFDLAGSYMNENVIVIWPNTNEVFRGRDNFFLAQKNYPGIWRINLERLVSKADLIISVVRVKSEDNLQEFYATSFFEFKEGLIEKITEYWGDISEPPEWRKKGGWSERIR